MSHEHHKAAAPRRVRVFVLTISDTRTAADDTGGQLCRSLLSDAGHEIVGHTIVRDDPQAVIACIKGVADGADTAEGAQVLISTGGTGVSRRDTTYEAVSSLLSKRLDGFGEIFRMLSYQEIGSAAMLSRALGGLIIKPNGLDSLTVFALPGSPKAVRLALTQLIIPELGHLTFEAHR